MNFIEILDTLGRASTVLVILTAAYAAYLWARGIVPVLWRLGNGLSRRKIALFARGDTLISLEALLDDSKLFDKANIVRIAAPGDIGQAESATLFLVAWHDWQDEIDRVLATKRDGTALIVYAPQDKGFIPQPEMAKLNSRRNVVVNNFRGRLLNDLVVSMITTSYEKR